MRNGPIVAALAVALSASPALAAPKTFVVATKAGRSNVEVTVVLHPQVDRCAKPLVAEIRKQVALQGAAHVRAHLKTVVKASGTDASGKGQFFGLSFLAGCPADGTAWIAFPAQGKDKQVSRFAPGLGWSPMQPI
ncbi:hypothetical protein [Hansschlegelia sp. KR7-227]|uniref:hypothetical protein n=1 Tax=Hansschlegelia sp. KR7-227 TaxID=3400914 RepID=UPI003BFCAC12